MSISATAEIWALNLAPADHDDGGTLLYHFNPRAKERGGLLVENDKTDDDWGRAKKSRLPHQPALFGLERKELAFKFKASPGHVDILVTVDRVQATAWRLRSEAPRGAALALLVPTRDDFGNRQGVTVHDAWWGKLPRLPGHRPYREQSFY